MLPAAFEMQELLQTEKILETVVRVGVMCWKSHYKFNHAEYIKETSEIFMEGNFRKCFFFDNKPEGLPILEQLLSEKIIRVSRCCCSLTGSFPSGLITLITWPLVGECCRHEYSIIETTNFVVCIELGSEDGKAPGDGGDKNFFESMKASISQTFSDFENKIENQISINYNVYFAPTEDEKLIAIEKYLGYSKKQYHRVLKLVQGDDMANLEFSELDQLISLYIHLVRAINGNYDVLKKNCKSLARSIIYFSEKDMKTDIVLCSLIGMFSDKPFKISHVDMELLQKVIFDIYKRLSADLQREYEKLVETIEHMHSGEDILDAEMECALEL